MERYHYVDLGPTRHGIYDAQEERIAPHYKKNTTVAQIDAKVYDLNMRNTMPHMWSWITVEQWKQVYG